MRPFLATWLARAEAWLRRVPALELSPSMSPAALKDLACQVERRYPEALVGENPFFARMVQSRAGRLIAPLLGCDIRCPLPSPVLMPYPYGIVINRGSSIGSRVTVMHQVTIFDAAIEDNVTIGPGAKIIGPLRIGRGARIGANAVVTADVPSHSTENVAPRRQEKIETVVNM
jgi:serine acetyltransferase